MHKTFEPASSNSALRLALNEISHEQVGGQIAAIENLEVTYPHAVTLMDAVANASPGSGQYNCYM
jgi:hypothetical protein